MVWCNRGAEARRLSIDRSLGSIDRLLTPDTIMMMMDWRDKRARTLNTTHTCSGPPSSPTGGGRHVQFSPLHVRGGGMMDVDDGSPPRQQHKQQQRPRPGALLSLSASHGQEPSASPSPSSPPSPLALSAGPRGPLGFRPALNLTVDVSVGQVSQPASQPASQPVDAYIHA